MPRPQLSRRICEKPRCDCFKPENAEENEEIVLTLDEYEVIRLVDYEKLTHEECARQMDVSRTTVTNIYESARYKVSDSIVNGKKLRIEGGNYRFCDGTARCRHSGFCTRAKNEKTEERGEKVMKIAVTYENGEIFQHFGHTEQFKLYTVEDGKITAEEIVDTCGSGHGALAGFLAANGVNTLVCGGIGAGAKTALAESGIRLYGGACGNADEAVKSLIAGTLSFNPDVRCSHHDSENQGEHSCGDHGCGSHSCH
ncbi:MAG: DUF134 domain-containing protein [Ruminococcus sp.]|nr:DUF134 domain-containing protein [Ruminococcus sp.]